MTWDIGSKFGSFPNHTAVDECLGTDGLAKSEVVFGIVIVNLLGISLSIVFLLIGIGFLVFKEKLSTKFQFIECQICACLAVSELFNVLGFLVSPCQPLEISDEAFKVFCVACSAVQLFSTMSTFVWILLMSVHICHLVAKECMKEERVAKPKPLKRRMTLEEMALAEGGMGHKKAERKISRDLLEVWKDNIRPSYEREQEKITIEEDKIKKEVRMLGFIQLLSEGSCPRYATALIGYGPTLVLTLVSSFTSPTVEYPVDGIDHVNPWNGIEGLDVYCWPGTETQMLYYMLGVVLLMFACTVYLRVKSIQMVRVLRGDPMSSLKQVKQWQREQSGLEKPPKNQSFHLESTALEIMIVTFSWIIGLLQTFYIWGLMLPFGTLSFLKGFIFFLNHGLKTTTFYNNNFKCAKKEDIENIEVA